MSRQEEIEARMRGLLADAGLPMPDEVEHGETQIRLLWNDKKVAVVIELDDEPCAHGNQYVNDRSQFVCRDCGEELGR